MTSAEFEPVIPATKRLKTLALDRSATGRLVKYQLNNNISPWGRVLFENQIVKFPQQITKFPLLQRI